MTKTNKKTASEQLEALKALSRAAEAMEQVMAKYGDNIRLVQSAATYDEGLVKEIVRLVNAGVAKSLISSITNISSGLIGRWCDQAEKK